MKDKISKIIVVFVVGFTIGSVFSNLISNSSNQSLVTDSINIKETKETMLDKQNVIKAAQSLLETTSLSKVEFIKQLELKGFSTDLVIFAIDILNINWDKNCELQAKKYSQIDNYSSAELVQLLKQDGFTDEQINSIDKEYWKK